MEKISIVSTIYNKAPWLERFFDTILKQTYQNIEVIAVNNASTDNSSEIIDMYASKDPRVKVVQIGVNNGPSNGFKAGINAVSGSYFTIIDADDYIDVDYIEKLYFAIKDEDADVSMCVNDMVWDNGRKIHKPWPKNDKYVIEGELAKKLPSQMLNELSDNYFGHYMPEIGAVWCKMYKTDFIRENNINFEDNYWIWCDFVFHLSVMKRVKKLVYITTTCYHFYQSDNSVTRSNHFQPQYLERVLLAMNKIYEGCQDIMTKELEMASNRFYLRRIYDVASFYYSFYPSVVSSKELNGVVQVLLNSPGGQQLSRTKAIPQKTLLDRIMLYALLHNQTIKMFRYLKLKTIPRRSLSYIYRLITKKNNN